MARSAGSVEAGDLPRAKIAARRTTKFYSTSRRGAQGGKNWLEHQPHPNEDIIPYTPGSDFVLLITKQVVWGDDTGRTFGISEKCPLRERHRGCVHF